MVSGQQADKKKNLTLHSEMLIPDKDVLNTHSLIFVSIIPVCIGIVTFGMDFKEQLVHRDGQ